ncbi:MAG: hypothetical protein LQ338_004354 [Usnochroma carphineum]|nr:MAG: hypothetical protein LQ338_004354 [Usnochroma carphineum]
MSEHGQSPGAGGNTEEAPKTEHLNIKVTDNNNEVFFKIKRTTALKKLMDAFCERQGKNTNTVRFLFDGARVNQNDTPDSLLRMFYRTKSMAIHPPLKNKANICSLSQLDMADGDTLEVHQEQIGG